MLKRSVLTIPVALALVAALAIGSAVEASVTSSPSSSAHALSAARLAGAPAPNVLPRRIRITGQVMLIFANGNFRLNNGRRNFTIIMTRLTSVVNLRGREVPRQFIRVANKVTVTGVLRRFHRIRAKVVLVYTRKDGP
jgi:hypothetical protein